MSIPQSCVQEVNGVQSKKATIGKSASKLILASAFLMGTLPLAANAQTYGVPEGLNLTGNSAVKWETNIIPVCWENPDSSNQDGRDWSRSAVEDTWQKNSQLVFTGWNECKSDSQGIRIRIADETARSIVGKGMSDRENGMHLNFTFKNWFPGCSKTREACIKAYTVHEFGHALGFAHEQIRKDTPKECKSLYPVDDEHRVGETQYVTTYDANSVMSYCSGGSKAGVHNDGVLTSYDIEGVQEWYGKSPVSIGKFVDWTDISASELGNPGSLDARFRAVNDWAGRNGYAAGFPNFHQADYGNGVVYGTILLKEGVEWRDISASELGNPGSLDARFRAVNDWAGRNGYAAGFPNFHQADYGNGVVYGTILLKK